MKSFLRRANKRITFGNAASLLMVATLMSQMLGFFRNRLVSANFTRLNPGSTDAFFAANQIPDFFFLTIAAGALGVVLVPVLADRLFKGDKKGMWEITNSMLNSMAIVMSVVAVIILVFARPLLHYIVAPKLPPEQLDQATTIMRLIALNPLLFTLSGIITSVQQTFGRFFFYALAPLFYNLSIIISIYVFKDHLGVIGLGVGGMIGAVAQLAIACLGLIGLGYRYRPKINLVSDDFRLLMRKLPARSVDQGIDSINSIVETNRATTLGTGAVTYYNFSTTLMNVPVMLFGTAIATAAFPRLADRLAQGRPDLFHRDFFKILRIMIWLALPVVAIGYFTRGYLARLLYGDVSPQVAVIFGFFAACIFFRIIYTIISRYFYAQKDTMTPLLVSLFAIGLNIFLVFHLAKPEAYGAPGLAMAQSIVAATEVVILFLIMFMRDPYMINRAFWGACLRILSVTGFSLLTAFIMISLLPLKLTDRGLVTLGAKFCSIAFVTFAVHFAISWLFGLEEVNPIIEKVRKIVLKPVRIQ